MTRRQQFIEVLKQILEPKGFKVFNEVSIDIVGTATKLTRFGDAVVTRAEGTEETEDQIRIDPNSLVCVLETKRSTVSVHSGLSQLIQNMQGLDASLGFSTNFIECIALNTEKASPEIKPHQPPFGLGPNQKLSQVARFIERVISREEKLLSVGEDEETVLRVLNSVVAELSDLTREIGSDFLEEYVGLFMAKKFDRKYFEVHGFEEFEREIERAAAYLIVNQILFYAILAKEVDEYPDLWMSESLEKVQKMFDTVLEDDFIPVFGRRLLPNMPSGALGPINELIQIIKKLNIDSLKRDIIGKVFHSTLPTEIRKRIAAYYTRNASAALLATLCIHDSDALVADISCGSGTFLVQAYHRKKDLSRQVSEKSHLDLIAEIFGIDISVFAAHLAAINLSLQDPRIYTNEVNIILSDALLMSPGGTIPIDMWSDERVVASVDGTRTTSIRFPPVDTVLMNPPFTQTRRMEDEYKKFLKKLIVAKRWQPYLSETKIIPVIDPKRKYKGVTREKVEYTFRWLNLHSVFLVHAFDFIKQGGNVAAVLPAQTVSADYSEPLKNMFSEFAEMEILITSEAQLTFSEDCEWKEILLVAKKTKKNATRRPVKFVTLLAELTMGNFIDYAESIRLGRSSDTVRITEVPFERLSERTNWNFFFQEQDIIDEIMAIENLEKMVKGHNLWTTEDSMIRGIEPRGTEFFILPNKFWKLRKAADKSVSFRERATSKVLHIPKKFLLPILRTPADAQSVIPSTTGFFLSIPEGSSSKPLEEYIELTQSFLRTEDGVNIPAIARVGSDWVHHISSQERAKVPPGRVGVLKKFMPNSRSVFAFYNGEERFSLPNTFYLMGYDDPILDKALVCYLNSTFFLIQVLAQRNVLGRASEELTEGRLMELSYPDFSQLRKGDLNAMAGIIDDYGSRRLPSVLEQEHTDFRHDVDLALARTLGVKGPESYVERLREVYFSRCGKLYAKPKGPHPTLDEFEGDSEGL